MAQLQHAQLNASCILQRALFVTSVEYRLRHDQQFTDTYPRADQNNTTDNSATKTIRTIDGLLIDTEQ